MKTSIEKIKECYVICSLDLNGNTCYLRSLHEKGKWEITTDVEMATKCMDRDAARYLRAFYLNEIGDGEWVVTPLMIQYMLIDETEGGDTIGANS